MPEEDIYVIALTNNNGNSPTDIAVQMASMAAGKPYPQVAGTELSEAELQKWVGAYQFDGDVRRFVTAEEGRLYSQREGSEKLPLIAVSDSEFYFEGSFTKYTFKMEDGKKTAYFEDRINKAKGVETVAPIPVEVVQDEIELPVETLKNYEGTYEIQPGFNLKVYVEDNKLMTQATGQPSFQIFASGNHNFFVKEFDAAISFDVDENGVSTGATLNQNGQSIAAKKKVD